MKMFKAILLLVFLSFSGAALAQQGSEDQTMNIMSSIFSVDPAYMETDGKFEYQHRYLGSIFGTFIFQIWNSGDPESITPLAYAIGFVNIISMLLAVITFLYVYILGAVGTASDASLLGKDNSATFIPVRTAVGFGLLMPVPGIGGGVFSTIQLLIVWIIVTGSNAATVMWNGVVKYIADNPEMVLSSGTIDRTVAYDFGKMLSCSMILQQQFADNNRWNRNRLQLASFNYANGESSGETGINLESTLTGGFLGFGRQEEFSLAENYNYVTQIAGNYNLQEILFSNGVCGSITFPVADVADMDHDTNKALYTSINNARTAASLMMNNVHVAISSMTQEFDDFRAIREQYESSEGGVGGELASYSQTFRESATQYGDIIQSSLNHNFGYDNNEEAAGLVERLSHGGWMNSIFWFYERAIYTSGRSTVINQFNNAFKFGNVPNICNDVDRSDESEVEACGEQQANLSYAVRTIDTFLVESGFEDDAARRKMSNACPFGPECASTQSMSTSQDLGNEGSRHISARLLSARWVGAGHEVDSTSGRVNPFTVMSDLGHNMNRMAFATWVAVGATKSVVSAAADSARSVTVPGLLKPSKYIGVFAATALENMVKFTLLSIGPVVLSIMANGFVLAYVVPFMPVLTWIAMLIGYLMMTIEAVIAAPLAVVLMFTPEGRGIVGTRLQSAINLINACTLRPMLMTLGVLAGVQISYVAYEILNTFFWQVAENYLRGSLFDFIAVLVVYVTSCYQVCKLIVSAIPRLPDQIMQWMSSGVGRAFGESEAMSNEASAGHLSKGVGAGFGGGNASGGIMKNTKGKSMKQLDREGK